MKYGYQIVRIEEMPTEMYDIETDEIKGNIWVNN